MVYDDVSVNAEFIVNKRVLVDGVDFVVDIVEGTFDPTNESQMPQFILTNKSSDWDDSQFTVVPDFNSTPVNVGINVWLYPIILQPNESVMEDFEIAHGAVFAIVEVNQN